MDTKKDMILHHFTRTNAHFSGERTNQKFKVITGNSRMIKTPGKHLVYGVLENKEYFKEYDPGKAAERAKILNERYFDEKPQEEKTEE